MTDQKRDSERDSDRASGMEAEAAEHLERARRCLLKGAAIRQKIPGEERRACHDRGRANAIASMVTREGV